jgi:hypothetical protein
MIPQYLVAVLLLFAGLIADARSPQPSPVWRRRVTSEADSRRSGQWRPAGRWRSTAGPNRVTPRASGTG